MHSVPLGAALSGRARRGSLLHLQSPHHMRLHTHQTARQSSPPHLILVAIKQPSLTIAASGAHAASSLVRIEHAATVRRENRWASALQEVEALKCLRMHRAASRIWSPERCTPR